MRSLPALVRITACFASAEAPHVAGVWKADLQKSSTWGQCGEQHTIMSAFDNGEAIARLIEDVPSRPVASSSGTTFTVTGEVAGRPHYFDKTYELSPGGDPQMSTVLLAKQPDFDSLKSLPVSDFFNQMHYFSWSLGKPCTFCQLFPHEIAAQAALDAQAKPAPH